MLTDRDFNNAADKAFGLFLKTKDWSGSAQKVSGDTGIPFNDIDAMMQNISEDYESLAVDSDCLATFQD